MGKVVFEFQENNMTATPRVSFRSYGDNVRSHFEMIVISVRTFLFLNECLSRMIYGSHFEMIVIT